MFFHPDPQAGRGLLEKKLRLFADEHAKSLKLPIWIDQALVHEAFDAAYSTVDFHKIPLGKINHYKELAHVGFWVSRLKPLSIQAPVTPDYFIKWVGAALKCAVEGNQADLAPVWKRYDAAAKAYKKHAVFPISEYVALQLIGHFIEAEFRRKADAIKDPAIKAVVEERLVFFKATLYGRVFPQLVQGLRFHVFTPRSFATLVEAVFAFDGLE